MSVDSKDIPITSPCPITLDKSGVGQGDRSLHCGHCVKDVHLLSNMTESEAREFLRTQSGNDICVSYTIQKGGGIRFANPDESRCSSSAPDLVPVSALTRRARPEPVRASAPAAFLAGLGAALLMAACAPHSNASAIKAEEITLAPIAEQVVIPCNPEIEEVVEGGIGEIEVVLRIPLTARAAREEDGEQGEGAAHAPLSQTPPSCPPGQLGL